MGTRLIGRDVELGAILIALDHTAGQNADGPGRIVLLSGEAGIGKSRLATETVAAAAQRGFTTLEGRAHPLHAGLAYAPIVEALRPHLSQDITDLAGPRHSSLEPMLAKARMFEAVTNVIQQLAPALLFIDDVHWADLGTVELAHYISHNTNGVLVLVTCREPSGPLRDLAMAIRREDPRDEIALRPLTDPAVAELATEVLGAPPSAALLKDLTQRARGNPLFVTALASAPIDQRALPTIVRDIVLGRLHSLSESARRLVEIVAVAGDAGSDDLLRGIWDDGDFDAELRRLVQGGLVTEHIVGRTVVYRIAHPLYAEVAYSELTARERRHLHAALAEAIDRDRPGDVLALAPHYLGAGDLVDTARTAEVLAEAGWRALEIHAEDEAVRYLTAALAETRAPDLRIGLLDALGRVHQGSGRFNEAREVLRQAIELAQQVNDRERLGTMAYWLALLETEGGDTEAADRYIEIAAGAERPTAPDLATEYTVLGMHFALRTNDLAYLEQGSKQLVDDGGPAEHIGKVLLALQANDWDTARREAETTVVMSDQVSGRLSTMLVTLARTQLLLMSMLSGDLTDALRQAEAIRDAPAVYEYSMFTSWAHYYVSFVRYLMANLTEALADIEKGVELERHTGRPRMLAWMLISRAWLLAELGRFDEALAGLAEAESAFGGGVPDQSRLAMVYASAKTLLLLYQGHPEQRPSLPTYKDMYDPIVTAFWLLYDGIAASAVGDTERATHVVMLLRLAGQAAPLVGALGERLAGVAGDPAASLSAAERLEAMGVIGFAAQARLEWAERIRDPGPIQNCVAVFEHAGMSPWVDRSRQLAKALGVRITGRRPIGLSKRESQVVRLLGEGLSNADIAARLFVSERTVESHLRGSYAKLGLSSRIALARWSAENQDPASNEIT
jgi:DNA-binding CsgD family transcriptional regulator/tetratricopeptide (TPR) repeat protein